MLRRLHPLFETEGAIGAESESISVESSESAPEQTQEAETKESESSFAKRLREHSEKEVKNAREAWEKENGEKYKDYDTLKETADFFREKHGYSDLLSMKEEIEMVKLQERAAKNENISPEMQRRLEVLEAKAAKGDELEQQQQESQRVATYFSALGDFVKDKGIESEKLNQFMIDNEMTLNPNDLNKTFNLAYKAMRAEELESKLQTAEKDAVKNYLESKKAPRVEGSGAPGQVQQDPPKTFDEAARRSKERYRALQQSD